MRDWIEVGALLARVDSIDAVVNEKSRPGAAVVVSGVSIAVGDREAALVRAYLKQTQTVRSLGGDASGAGFRGGRVEAAG